MKKKQIIGITVLILIVFGGLLPFRLANYIAFRNYLKDKYPDKAFTVHWVKYDFIYNNRYYATAYCKDDKTTFYIRSERSGISEEYLETRNRAEMNEVLRSSIMEEPVSRYIREIRAGVEDDEVLDTEQSPDYKGIIDRVHVYFNDDKLTDDEMFADTAFQLIRVLKEKQYTFKEIDFTQERNKGVYELRLKGEELNNSKEEIKLLIYRLK
ncbi:MAG TPA: hypothetical protein VEG39_08185 [Clostridia bacterium]|nr:hypothetical protein [Clostridia bacterium]